MKEFESFMENAVKCVVCVWFIIMILSIAVGFIKITYDLLFKKD